jgi:hypothetical protein
MAWRSIVGRSLGIRWSRAAAVLLACAVGAQAGQLPLLAAAEAATCCCPHRTAEEACGCPVCAHRRQLEAGHAVIESCGAAARAPAVVPPDAVLPPAVAMALRSTPALTVFLVASPPPEPAVDVPTPPPVARG